MKLYICEDFRTAKWRKYILSDKKLSLAFAKKCLCDYIGEKESNIEIIFSKNEYGKPYAESIYKFDNTKTNIKTKIDISLFFSVSHSENMMICAVACFNTGADCQKKNTDDIESCRKIAARFFSGQEIIFLNNFLEPESQNKEYIDNFFKIWTKKEAYIKYTGKGLSEGMQNFSVTTEKRHKSYCGDVYFKKFDLPGRKKTKDGGDKIKNKKNSDKYYVYLCYDKANKNIWQIKYFN